MKGYISYVLYRVIQKTPEKQGIVQANRNIFHKKIHDLQRNVNLLRAEFSKTEDRRRKRICYKTDLISIYNNFSKD